MEKLYHDVFLYILSYLNHKDLISLMRVSKTFYTYIDNLKLPNVDFYTACEKGYYLNIRKELKNIKNYDINKAFVFACKSGNIDIIKLLILHGANNWNSGLVSACEHGHENLIDFLCQKGANIWDQATRVACRNGQKKIAKKILKYYPYCIDSAFHGACEGGHINLVNYLIYFGVPKWYIGRISNMDIGLYFACKNGHKEIIKLLIKNGANNWKYGLQGAYEGGKTEIIEYIKTLYSLTLD